MRPKEEILADIQENEEAKRCLEEELNSVLLSDEAKARRDSMPMQGNVGEWSEIYVFYKMMQDGKIKSARPDANGRLQPIYDAFLPVLKIIREDDGIPLEYYTSNDYNGIKALKIYYGGREEPMLECSVKDFESKANELLAMLQTKDEKLGIKRAVGVKGGSYEIPNHKKFLNDIFITKLKSPATQISKSFGGISDITMEIIQQDNLRVPVGFSIKSSLGAQSALLNSSGANNVRYLLENCNDHIMNFINGINTNSKIVDRVQALLYETGIGIKVDGFTSQVFEDNLELIADRMAEVLGYAVLYSYDKAAEGNSSNRKTTDVLGSLIAYNPLNIENNREVYYTKRLKDLLFERACGMEVATPWNGDTKISGGYIFVSRAGDVLAFYASDQDAYKDWLLKSTRFDTPSTSRQEVGIITKENGNYYFTLSTLIKFIG